MQLPDTYIVALITFTLGIVSAAYGAQIGKSFEARKELLEKMRDWVDEILLQLNALYLEEILEKRNAVSWEQNRLSFNVHWIRWLGIVKGLRSSRLLFATNDFIVAVKDFNKRYDAVEKSQDDNLKRKHDLLLLVNSLEDKAQILHEAITQESVQIPFWSVHPYSRLGPIARRMMLVIILIIILIVTGLYFKLL